MILSLRLFLWVTCHRFYHQESARAHQRATHPLSTVVRVILLPLVALFPSITSFSPLWLSFRFDYMLKSNREPICWLILVSTTDHYRGGLVGCYGSFTKQHECMGLAIFRDDHHHGKLVSCQSLLGCHRHSIQKNQTVCLQNIWTSIISTLISYI